MLNVRIAPFRDAMDLKNAIEKAISKRGISLSSLSLETNIDELVPLFLEIDSDEAVYNRLMTCASRCTINNVKITEDYFENNREEYYPVMIEVLKANIMPFFKGLVSKLSNLNKAQNK